MRSRQLPVERVNTLEQADAVLSLRRHLGRDPEVRRRAQQQQVPILVIKADTLPQILRGWSGCCAAAGKLRQPWPCAWRLTKVGPLWVTSKATGPETFGSTGHWAVAKW